MKLICLNSMIKLKYDIKHDVLKHKYENKTCFVFYIQEWNKNMELIFNHSTMKLKYKIKHDVLKHKYENKTCCVF